MSKKQYDENSIQTLEILEHMRKRVGMYLGGADDDAILVATREVIDNAVDEHLNGHGDMIEIAVDPETGVISVTDHARGIPTGPYSKDPGISTLEAAMTKGMTGGKFGDQYGISGGLNGIGLKAVTATSTHVRATVWREGHEHILVLNDSKVVGPLQVAPLAKAKVKRTGTRIEFRLDPAIFKDAQSTVPDRAALQRMLRERAYLCPGLKLSLQWGKEPLEYFYERDGLSAYVQELAGDKVLFKKVAHFENETDADVRVAVAVAWTSGYGRDNVQGFCNIVRQPEGGTHVQGLRMALPMAVRKYIEDNGLIPAKDKDLKVEGPDCFEGVYALVSIKHKSPVFKGQAKSKH